MMFRLLSVFALLTSCVHAHVTLNPRTAAPTYSYHSVRLPHGCGTASTTSMVVTIPEGAGSVKPEITSDWTARMTMRPLDPPVDNHGTMLTETVDTVVYEFAFPVANEYVFNVGLQVKFDSSAPDGTVFYFPVTQHCEDGSNTAWDELPDPVTGAPPAHPAPTVTIEAPVGLTGHEGHDDSAVTNAAIDTTAAGEHAGHGESVTAAVTTGTDMGSTIVSHVGTNDDDDWTSTDTMAVVAVAIAVVALAGLAQMAFLYGKIQQQLQLKSAGSKAGTENEPALPASTCNC